MLELSYFLSISPLNFIPSNNILISRIIYPKYLQNKYPIALTICISAANKNKQKKQQNVASFLRNKCVPIVSSIHTDDTKNKSTKWKYFTIVLEKLSFHISIIRRFQNQGITAATVQQGTDNSPFDVVLSIRREQFARSSCRQFA